MIFKCHSTGNARRKARFVEKVMSSVGSGDIDVGVNINRDIDSHI
jgi:hypothetical protein